MVRLRILHVLRAPVGGLFRHVCDLARGQAAREHEVGVIADASSGGAQAEAALADLAQLLKLGLTRVPMTRHIGGADLAAIRHVSAWASETGADVLHGHGAKGGAYVRLARGSRALRVYTPHGGSLHYRWDSPTGLFYLAAETVLKPRTDLFLFESAYGRDVFMRKIGRPTAPSQVIHNGVNASEFLPVEPGHEATDLVFVGELRMLKGVDVLIQALAQLAREGRKTSATIVGDGPDRAAFEAAIQAENLNAAVRFTGALPARTAFALGRMLVVPSRAESFPYIVLEAAAAGVPIIATNVGGIPEIFGPDAADLVPPGEPAALAEAIAATQRNPGRQQAATLRLQSRVRESFSVDAMTDAVLDAYGSAGVQRRG
jgi:glycosyltransferase involved in cell wall biosynthesis